jgi:co-chaperonin GroES (HSP10)
MIMIKVALKNPSDKNVVDYPISEAQVDEKGEVIIDRGTGQPKETGNTYEWTILAGQTVIFPKYVADYLRKVCDFLVEVRAPRAVRLENAQEEQGISDSYIGKAVPEDELNTEEIETKNEETGEVEVTKTTTLEERTVDGGFKCKYCDYVAKTKSGLGLHVAARHPEYL